MTRIESEKATVKQAASAIYTNLCDFNQIGKLMPPQVEGFVTDGETCSFDIKGMASLGMKYESKTPFTEIVMAKHEKGPFDFKLICSIRHMEDQLSELQLFFDADLNPFLRMMAEKPLANFLNLLLKKYQEIHS